MTINVIVVNNKEIKSLNCDWLAPVLPGPASRAACIAFIDTLISVSVNVSSVL